MLLRRRVREMYTIIAVMVIICIFILGLILGSFINALVWRLHKQSGSKKRAKQYSIISGRSQCVHCGHQLSALDLIPLFSWISLKGRCRYCNKAISWQYPAVELATAVTFAVSFLAWPAALTLFQTILYVLWLAIVVHLVALAVYDLKWMLLLDKLVIWLTAVSGLLIVLLHTKPLDIRGLLMAIAGGALLASLFYVLFQLSTGKWIGGGDVKIAFSLGLLAGSPLNMLLLLFIASIMGTIVALPLLIKDKNNLKAKLPFGPFLLVATFIVFLWGNSIIDWYMTNILLL